MEQTFFLTRRKICDQNFQCMYVHYNNVLIEQVNGKYALKKGTELNRIKWHRQVYTFPFSNARKKFLTRRLSKKNRTPRYWSRIGVQFSKNCNNLRYCSVFAYLSQFVNTKGLKNRTLRWSCPWLATVDICGFVLKYDW